MKKTIEFPLKAKVKTKAKPGHREHPNREGDREKKKERERASRRRFSPEFLVFLATTAVITLVVSLLLSPLAAITEIQVEGNNVLSDEKIIVQAGQPVGQNVFLYRTRQAASTLELDPYIDKAKISRQPFHRILIQIMERAPVGILVDGNAYLHFSSNGMVMDVSESLQTTKLPIITGLSLESVPAPGDMIRDETFHEALVIANACSPELLMEIQEINVSNPANILAYTGQGIEVRIGCADESISRRMQSLDDIYQQVVLSGRLPAPVDYIDIRYEGAPSIKMIGYEAPIAELEGLEAIEIPVEYQRPVEEPQ